jgi:hypothetical protein
VHLGGWRLIEVLDSKLEFRSASWLGRRCAGLPVGLLERFYSSNSRLTWYLSGEGASLPRAALMKLKLFFDSVLLENVVPWSLNVDGRV